MPKKSKNQIDIVEEYEPELEVEKDAGKDVEKEIILTDEIIFSDESVTIYFD